MLRDAGGSKVTQDPESDDDDRADDDEGRRDLPRGKIAPGPPPPTGEENRGNGQGDGEQRIHSPRPAEVAVGEVVDGAQTPAGRAQVAGEREDGAHAVAALVGIAQG